MRTVPLGYYRQTMWVDHLTPQPEYNWSPYYGLRRRYLESVRREVWQIEVDFLGARAWINAPPLDELRLEKPKPAE